MAKLQGDKEYQRRMREAEEERRLRREPLRRAEQPIVDDLRTAGFEVNSVWDLGRPVSRIQVPFPC
jgi:hypothetical protein